MSLENKEKTDALIINDRVQSALTYSEYRDLVSELAGNGATTGLEQKESLIEYTLLNNRRMARWDKTLKIPVEVTKKIKALNRKVLWLVLTESWCGDASPALPVMNKLSEINPNIDLKILLRDENLELMDRFLTNGSRSIPKLIVVDKQTEEVIGEWGPRPSVATKMAENYKKEHGVLTPEFKQDLQVWYNKNKGQNILKDLVQLLALK
ncbi:thioredoxin family protein [Allomuricauda sp. d1]|uniref:thioredoxin family protein n=1 Tax=Allomuricauda sp. d1 TaxID=3136725 RepID=UPI0031DB4933